MISKIQREEMKSLTIIYLIQRVREQNENDRAIGLARQIELEQTFKPIVSATEKTTTGITNELKSDKSNPTPSFARKKRKISERSAFDIYQTEGNLDKYYAIKRVADNELRLGDKEVLIDEHSNIIVDNTTCRGTKGLLAFNNEASS